MKNKKYVYIFGGCVGVFESEHIKDLNAGERLN
jgi:hypothetical protein